MSVAAHSGKQVDADGCRWIQVDAAYLSREVVIRSPWLILDQSPYALLDSYTTKVRGQRTY